MAALLVHRYGDANVLCAIAISLRSPTATVPVGLDPAWLDAPSLVVEFGPQILLRGLLELSPAAAAQVSTWRCSGAWLGVRDLSAAVANELARFRGELYLPRVETLTPDAAEALSRSRAARLCLDGLTGISSAAAASLRRCAVAEWGLTEPRP